MDPNAKKKLIGAVIAAACAIAVYYGLIDQKQSNNIQTQADQSLGTAPRSAASFAAESAGADDRAEPAKHHDVDPGAVDSALTSVAPSHGRPPPAAAKRSPSPVARE